MKVRCDKTKRLLVDFAAGELSPRLSEGVREHIDICSKCREEYEYVLRILQTVRETPLTSPPEQTRERILQRLSAESEVKKPVSVAPVWRRPVFAGAAAMLVLALGLLMLMVFKGPAPEEVPYLKSGSQKVRFGLAGTRLQDFQDYMAETNDVFYKIAIENVTELDKLIERPDPDTGFEWNLENELIWKVAMAMELKEEIDKEKYEFAFGLLEDVEKVWKQVYQARDAFPEGAESIRELIRQKYVLDRINQVID